MLGALITRSSYQIAGFIIFCFLWAIITISWKSKSGICEGMASFKRSMPAGHDNLHSNPTVIHIVSKCLTLLRPVPRNFNILYWLPSTHIFATTSSSSQESNILSSSECSAQGQVLHCKRRSLGCSSAQGRSSNANSGTKPVVLPGNQ